MNKKFQFEKMMNMYDNEIFGRNGTAIMPSGFSTPRLFAHSRALVVLRFVFRSTLSF